MKLFIDTADVGEIREAHSWGIVDGVTTNLSLVAKTGRDFEVVLREICAIVDGPVSAEVVSTDAAGMVEEGERLARIHRNIVVKCPLIAEGLKATRLLTDRSIRVNMTLVFARAGAARRESRRRVHLAVRRPPR
jgi:transaldolase